MLNNDSKSPCGILYVDDEEKALKYFRLAWGQKYPIFTASSPKEGLEVLRREGTRVGIVLSDQRMPEMLGAQFLGLVRDEFPSLVRILTTAYSDLESAIEAVNTGHIYQYVVKPWEVPELGMVLQRAADYSHVLSERNELLELKMGTMQRIICSDRLKWLLLSSRALDSADQSAFRRALAAFIGAMPEDLRKVAAGHQTFNARQFEVTGLIRDEYHTASKVLDSLSAIRVASPPPFGPGGLEKAAGDLVAALSGFLSVQPRDVILEINGSSNAVIRLPALPAGKLAPALFSLLMERAPQEVSIRLFAALLVLGSADGSLKIVPHGDAELVFSTQGTPDADAVIGELYEKFSASDISRL